MYAITDSNQLLLMQFITLSGLCPCLYPEPSEGSWVLAVLWHVING
jgi:hypothetical protein